MKFKRNQVEDVHINLTPMIDCLLFILVFCFCRRHLAK